MVLIGDEGRWQAGYSPNSVARDSERYEDDRAAPFDEEADEPLAAKIADEEVREDRRADDDDRLRGEGDHQRVPQCRAEVGVVPDAREVVEAYPVAGERPADRVCEAEVDRPAERYPDDEQDEDDGRRDERGREEPPLLEEIPPAFPPMRSHRRGFHAARILK